MDDGIDRDVFDHDTLAQLAKEANETVGDYLKLHEWGADPNEPLRFEPDAILPLGDGEYIRMADARAEHVERHLQFLRLEFAQEWGSPP